MLSLDSPTGEGLRDGLRELGYIEGKNIVLDSRATGATDEELRAAAIDLARSKADLILAGSTLATRAALEATTLPIVFLVGDPIASGFAVSLARPGGRATGVSMLTTELAGKRLELLRVVAQKAGRIVFMMNSANPTNAWQLKEAQEAARTLGVQLTSLDVQAPGGIDAALSRLPRSRASGVVVAAEIVFLVNRVKISQAVRKAKLPAIFPATEYHDAGVLLTYGPNLKNVGHVLANYVDRVLKGSKPADLPIEQLSKFELVVDLREARQLGIEVPDTLLLRADKVIR
ncbi:MAG TPA: ABC transporter substrate-binding protein [Burkholderiales bacterium]|nr:ABC transporter substrate-binding protein [Burkholderiales bacterium]